MRTRAQVRATARAGEWGPGPSCGSRARTKARTRQRRRRRGGVEPPGVQPPRGRHSAHRQPASTAARYTAAAGGRNSAAAGSRRRKTTVTAIDEATPPVTSTVGAGTGSRSRGRRERTTARTTIAPTSPVKLTANTSARAPPRRPPAGRRDRGHGHPGHQRQHRPTARRGSHSMAPTLLSANRQRVTAPGPRPARRPSLYPARAGVRGAPPPRPPATARQVHPRHRGPGARPPVAQHEPCGDDPQHGRNHQLDHGGSGGGRGHIGERDGIETPPTPRRRPRSWRSAPGSGPPCAPGDPSSDSLSIPTAGSLLRLAVAASRVASARTTAVVWRRKAGRVIQPAGRLLPIAARTRSHDDDCAP